MSSEYAFFAIQLGFSAAVVALFGLMVWRHRRACLALHAEGKGLEARRQQLHEKISQFRKAEAARKRQAAKTAAHHAGV